MPPLRVSGEGVISLTPSVDSLESCEKRLLRIIAQFEENFPNVILDAAHNARQSGSIGRVVGSFNSPTVVIVAQASIKQRTERFRESIFESKIILSGGIYWG